jgi:hypothetical protein
LRSVDKPTPKLKITASVDNRPIHPQAYTGYPSPSWPADHRVLNLCTLRKIRPTDVYPQKGDSVRINIKTKIL